MAGKKRRGGAKLLAGIAISVACIAYLVYRIDFAEVRDAFASFAWAYLLVALASLAFGYSMRIVRWAVMLRSAGARVSSMACAAPFLGSIALNNTLPMRMGDVVRALVFPFALGIGRTTSTVSLVFERIVDLLTLLACLAVGMAFGAAAEVPRWIADGALTLAICVIAACVAIVAFSGRLAAWIAARLVRGEARPVLVRGLTLAADVLRNVDAMSRSGVVAVVAGLSVLVWLGEAGVFWSVLRGFALPAGATTALLVMAIATLSTLVPSSPGYVGPFHVAAFAAISMMGGTSGQAASFAVISHLAVWLPTTVAGAVAILLKPELFSGVRPARALHRNAACGDGNP